MSKAYADQRNKKKKDEQQQTVRNIGQSVSASVKSVKQSYANNANSAKKEQVRRTQQAKPKYIPNVVSKATRQGTNDYNQQKQQNRPSEAYTQKKSAQIAKTASDVVKSTRKEVTRSDALQRNEYQERINTSLPKNERKTIDDRTAKARNYYAEGTAEEISKEDVDKIQNGTIGRVGRNTGKIVANEAPKKLYGYGYAVNDLFKQRFKNDPETAAMRRMGVFKEDEAAKAQKAAGERKDIYRGKIEEYTDTVNEATKDATGLEKAWYGAVQSGVGMGMDQLWGPFWGLSMGLGTYSDSKIQALREGATDEEATMYGALQAAKEVGTEYMHAGIGMARGLKGAGVLDRTLGRFSLWDRLPDTVLTRYLSGISEEMDEEIAGWIFDPWIKEYTYGRRMRQDEARNALIQQGDAVMANITDEASAQNLALYLGTDEFRNQSIKDYMDAGFSKEEAAEMSDMMRDYLTARASGDNATAADLEEEISKRMARVAKEGYFSDDRMKDLGDTLLSTALLTGITGAPGAMNTRDSGRDFKGRYEAVYGDQASMRMIQDAMESTDPEVIKKAEAAKAGLDSGQEISDTQAYDMMVAIAEENRKNEENAATAYDTFLTAQKKERLMYPFAVTRDGRSINAEVTDAAIRSDTRTAKKYLEHLNKEVKKLDGANPLNKTQIADYADAAGRYKSGKVYSSDARLVAYNNAEGRAVFEAMTGIKLDKYVVRNEDGTVDIAATNEATYKAFFANAAENMIQAARAETDNAVDKMNGRITEHLLPTLGSAGQAAWMEVSEGMDSRDVVKTELMANAFNALYRIGRNTNESAESALKMTKYLTRNIDRSVLEKAFNEGRKDREDAGQAALNQEIRIGEAVSNTDTASIQKGILDTSQLSVEARDNVKKSTYEALSAVAQVMGINIRLVEDMPAGKRMNLKTGKEETIQANGLYDEKTGDIVLNINESAENNLSYVVMHEMTHHLKLYAPQEYLALENLIRDEWMKQDPAQMQQRIDEIISLYKKAGQTLSEEQAMEEIVADAMSEAMQDDTFAAKVCETNAKLGKAVLNSIRSMLRKLRSAFSAKKYQDSNFSNALLSRLGILEQAERLWLDALTTAYQNQAAIGIEEWIQKNTLGQSERGESYSISPQQDADYMAAVESGDMETAQRMVDEAAEAAGYEYKVYHGTPSSLQSYSKYGEKLTDEEYEQLYSNYEDKLFPFTVFKNNARLTGIYTTTDKGIADVFSYNFSDRGTVYSLYAKADNPLRIDAKENGWNNIPFDSISELGFEKTKGVTLDKIAKRAKELGYDALIVDNVRETGSGDESSPVTTDIIVFSSDQAKLADPVTYDDNGNVIPLSERFNTENQDIRYSINGEEFQQARTDAKLWEYENAKEYFDKQYDLYKNFQEGTANRNNFMWNTLATFQETRRPKGKPDYVSRDRYGKVSSEYWYTDDGVIRGSNHWGTGISTCDWALQTKEGRTIYGTRDAEPTNMNKTYGKASWGDFIHKTEFVSVNGDSVLTSFENVVGKNTVSVDGTNYEYNQFDGWTQIPSEVREELNDLGADVTDGGTVTKYSITSWSDTDVDALRQKLIEAGYEEAVVDKWIEDVNSVAATIYGDMARLNYKADQYQSALKPNAEYYFTLDLSTLCQKRRLYQGTYNAIMHRLVNRALTPTLTVRLREMMDAMGYEVPCGICYEESRKKNEGKFADTWLNGETDGQFRQRVKAYKKALQNYNKKLEEYNNLEDKTGVKPPNEPKEPERWMGYRNMEHDDPFIPELNDVVTTDGRERLRKEHPEALEAYLDYQKKRGSANPKVSFTHTDYRGDILRMTPKDVENVMHIGGLRIQSFSDFETVHVIDMMQAVMDMAAMKLTAQAYTKVPAFADIFGGTGIKINLSLIQKMDANGKPMYETYIDENGEEKKRLVFDAKEGIDPNEAFRLRKKYSKNVGTILVGVSKEQILSAWADPRVDMVIPFHRSGWSVKEFEALGLKGYEDFQSYQSERYLDGSKNGISLAEAKKNGYIKSAEELYVRDYWDENKSGKENAEAYLKKCAEQKRRPVFYNFLKDNGDGSYSLQEDGSTDGYWKSLIDYKMYDNDGAKAPQELVQANFDMEAAQKVMDSYEGNADTLPVAQDVVDKFVEKYGPKKKFSITATDSDGNALTKGQREFFKNSKAVDENGNLLKLYHYSPAQFYEFKRGELGKNTGYSNTSYGFFVTNDESFSSRFGENKMELYANITNPIIHPEMAHVKYSEAECDEIVRTWYSVIDPEQLEYFEEMVEDEEADSLYDAYTQLLAPGEDAFEFANSERELLEESGFDAVEIVEGTESELRDDETGTDRAVTTYAVFHANQVKLTTNENPTTDPDTRYSLNSNGEELTQGQEDYFANSQARDEQGRLAIVYHTTDYGGFTVFDPSYSDDDRSLFFASNWNVSQTYGSRATERFTFDNTAKEMPEPYKSYDDFVGRAYLDFGFESFDDLMHKWSFRTRNTNDPFNRSRERYTASDWLNGTAPEYVWLQFNISTGDVSELSATISARNKEDFVQKINDYMETVYEHRKADTKRGYYECYLNLSNPLVIDANGANWHSIEFGPEEESTSTEEAIEQMQNDSDVMISYFACYRPWETFNDAGYSNMMHLEIDGKRKTADGTWEPIVVNVDLEVDFADYEDESAAMDAVAYKAEDYVEGLGIPLEYFDQLMEAYTDNDGDLLYDADDESKLGYDFITKDGLKLDESEYYTEYEPTYYSTREIAELAEEWGHDGVIIRNCYDIGGASKFKGESKLSDIYIAFSSNQVKDTRNENPTENPDIRFSITPENDVLSWLADNADQIEELPSDDPMEEEGRVRLAKSKEDYLNHLNAKWNEKWLTNGKILNEESVEKNIRNVIKSAMQNSATDKQYRTDMVKKATLAARSAYNQMKHGRFTDARNLLWDTAEDIVDNLEFINDDLYREYKDLRDYFRNTAIKISAEDVADLDWDYIRRHNLRRMKIRTTDGVSVDEAYQELSKKYPNLFSDELTHPADMLQQMSDVLDSLQPFNYVLGSEEQCELVDQVASELYDIIYDGDEYKSIADTVKARYDKQTKALKQRYQEAIQRVRDKGDIRLQKAVARERQKMSDYKQKQSDARTKMKKFGQIVKNYNTLCDLLLTNTKDKNIPEPFRKPLAEVLQYIDLQTERSKQLEVLTGRTAQKTLKLRSLQDKLADIANEDDFTGFGKDDYFYDLMSRLDQKLAGKSVDSMEIEDIIAVNELLKGIRHYFTEYKTLMYNNKRMETAVLGDTSIAENEAEIELFGQANEYGGLRRLWDNIVNMSELTPTHFFQGLDETTYGMYKNIRRGFDQYVRNEDMIEKKMRMILEDYYVEKKILGKKFQAGNGVIEEWRNSKSAQEIELSKGKVTMTVAQMMSLYCHSKRTQSMGHIMADGIVVTPIQAGAKLEKARQDALGKKEMVNSKKLSHADVQKVISMLTPEQIRIADAMQDFLVHEMADLGNEASMKLYGIKLFKEQNYFPIQVTANATKTSLEQTNVIEMLSSWGATKALKPGAGNAIIIEDIFTVVADHCNNMNLYNSYAVPVRDMMRFLNYKQYDENKENPKTVKEMIEKAYGKKSVRYLMNFLKDINGVKHSKRGGMEDFYGAALGNAKKAAVFGNVRVALQQPTAIVRAFSVMNRKYFRGVLPSDKATKEMFEHVPIALWKSWGYYDTFMGRDIEDVMMGNMSTSDVILSDVYGELDNMTWGMIWQAVKKEIADTHKDVEQGSEEFWRLCAERASYVFDATQVVDSPFHRSHDMRSDSTLVKMFTAFQSEPTLTFNMVRTGLVQARNELKKGNKKEAGRIAGNTLATFVEQAAVVAATAALWDAVRRKGKDDDDDKTYWDVWYLNFMKNLGDNVNLLNNIYVVKDIYALLASPYGGGNNNIMFQGLETMKTGFTDLKKKVSGESKKSWWDVMTNLLGGVGYFVGFPAKTLMKDIKSISKWFGLDVFAADGSVDKFIDNVLPTKSEGDTTGGTTSGGSSSKRKTKTDYSNEYEQALTQAESEGYSGEKRNQRAWEIMEEKYSGEHSEAAESESASSSAVVNQRAAEWDNLHALEAKALDKTNGLSSQERHQKMYEIVTEGYTKHIQKGDYEYIEEVRSFLEAHGCDVKKFDEAVLKSTKSEYKKTLTSLKSADGTYILPLSLQSRMREYMLSHGMTEADVSELMYNTNTAKDLKAAFRLGNDQYIQDEAVPLVQAGLSFEDFEKLYKNRNRYQTYDGKYKDEFKSTGILKWPITGTITSDYGYRGRIAGLNTNPYHYGIDIAGNIGDPIGAADGGQVMYVGYNGGFGNQVVIRHDDGTETMYSHLSAFNCNVGDTVGQGQIIGAVGSTGASTGPHLDFRVKVNGEYVNPLSKLAS